MDCSSKARSSSGEMGWCRQQTGRRCSLEPRLGASASRGGRVVGSVLTTGTTAAEGAGGRGKFNNAVQKGDDRDPGVSGEDRERDRRVRAAWRMRRQLGACGWLKSRYTSSRRKLPGRKVPRAGVQVARVPPAPQNQGSGSGCRAWISTEGHEKVCAERKPARCGPRQLLRGGRVVVGGERFGDRVERMELSLARSRQKFSSRCSRGPGPVIGPGCPDSVARLLTLLCLSSVPGARGRVGAREVA